MTIWIHSVAVIILFYSRHFISIYMYGRARAACALSGTVAAGEQTVTAEAPLASSTKHVRSAAATILSHLRPIDKAIDSICDNAEEN